MALDFQSRVVEHNGVEFVVRKLEESDREEYNRIIETQREKMVKSRHLNVDRFHDLFDDGNPEQSLHVGAFESGRLRSCQAMFLWNSFPYTTFYGLITDASHSRMFNPQKSGLLHTLRSLHAFCESIGYFQHYSVRHAKHIDREMATWNKYTAEFDTRYEL